MASVCHNGESGYVEDIRRALREKKLVIIIGAGVTLGATYPPPSRVTWKGLIQHGLDYLQNENFVETDDEDLRYYQRVLQRTDPKIDAVLRACDFLRKELDRHSKFPTWLKLVFGSLHEEVKHPEILEALHQFHRVGAKLMTTNYDELLEHHCNLPRIRYSVEGNVNKYRCGSLPGVFHIHGSFQDPEDVVLDPDSYYRVKMSVDVQELLKAYLLHYTILFVGCGTGLEDPNFKALLEWATNHSRNIPDRHYLLVREGDNLNYPSLINLQYGRRYEDLVPFLHALFPGPLAAQISADLETARNPSGTPTFYQFVGLMLT
jgi:hypothetical protein